MSKLTKKKQKTTEPKAELTEWQKRNVEFQQRKKERLAEKERLEAEERKKATDAELDQVVTDDDHQDEAADQLTDDSQATKDSPETSDKPAETKSKQHTVAQKTKTVQKNKPFLSQNALKALPILLFSSIVLVLSLFTLSPFSKQKVVTVTGITHTTEQDVVKATGIKADDYISHTALNLSTYEKNLLAKNPWIKKAQLAYQFPNTFSITVEEYPIVAYNETADGFRPILESGEQVSPIGDGQLPEGSLPLRFDKEKDTTSFIRQFIGLDHSVRQSIQQVSFANSASTPDLLLLTMAEGHTVRVPLSEIALKMPYYKTIKDKLTYPQIIDMEVGIYTTTPELEAAAAETKASKEQESRELAALTSSSSSSSNSTTQTESSSSSSSRSR